MKRSIAVCVLALASCLGAFAQVAGMGAISGAVRDASGAVVPDAQVVVANESKGIHRAIRTSEAGVFAATALVPATGYVVTVTKQGFSTYEAKDIQVQVGQNVDLAIVLSVAGAVTEVSVDAVAPIVDSTKTDVSQVIDTRQIQDLPINGRRVD